MICKLMIAFKRYSRHDHHRPGPDVADKRHALYFTLHSQDGHAPFGRQQKRPRQQNYRAAFVQSNIVQVRGGDRVGIVGRTGSGKSSLCMALFRIVEPEAGVILIDGHDTKNIGLRTLRKSLSMIPQDPFMFSGTVRRNLDPFEEHTDVEVWQALQAVNLKRVVEGLDGNILAKVTVNAGYNFSQGQLQLFCLARALLRKSKVFLRLFSAQFQECKLNINSSKDTSQPRALH